MDKGPADFTLSCSALPGIWRGRELLKSPGDVWIICVIACFLSLTSYVQPWLSPPARCAPVRLRCGTQVRRAETPEGPPRNRPCSYQNGGAPPGSLQTGLEDDGKR